MTPAPTASRAPITEIAAAADAAALRASVRDRAHNRPGVYRMIGPGGVVLYVGKSIRVRTRLLSYFRADRGEKAGQIIAHTHHIDWDDVPSEFAATVREMRAIQQWRPPFNVEHKRDRAFCFAKITRESAPRLLTVREAADDGALYYGPFRGPARVRDVLRQVADLLELRDCAGPTRMRFADQLDLFGVEHDPLCMRADLHRCLAPCAGRCSRSAYHAQVRLARRFLEGDADAPRAILRARIAAAAARLQFEYAAQLRDRLCQLAEASAELAALRGTIESLSFLYHVPGWNGEDRVYLIHRGAIRGEFPAPRTPAERVAIERAACHVLGRPAGPAPSLAPTHVAEILLLARWFRLRPHERDRTWLPPTEADNDS